MEVMKDKRAAQCLKQSQKAAFSHFIEDPATGKLYKKGRLLGKGAFGRCYKITDISTNQVYAVKIVPRSRMTQLQQKGKVEKEIELHSTLHHQNIVRFFHHFEDEQNTYMILEYCSKKSLAHILKARKVLPEPEVQYYMKQIVRGLQYLQQKGIIHRDLKLSNFFITKNMELKIGDFGLATKVGQAERKRCIVCGTPNYLAPEVINKKGHTFKSEIWALGCIMFTMLAGHSPFKTTTVKEMYRCIREGHYSMPENISPAAQNLIASLLAQSPGDRPCLDEVIQHAFFSQGVTPERLSSNICSSTPVFAVCNPMNKVLHKAARILFRRELQKGKNTDKSAVKGQSRVFSADMNLRKPSLSKEDKQVGTVEFVNQQSMQQEVVQSKFAIQLMMKGSLGSQRPSCESEADWTRGSIANSITRVLHNCLKNMPEAFCNPKEDLLCPVLWVTKWVDYSNKYGFGYQLSGNITGVLLNDSTHIALYPQLQMVCYTTEIEESWWFPRKDVPSPLSVKMGILRFFAEYMKHKLLEGGNLHAPSELYQNVCLLHFVKTDQAVLMLLSNGTLQVNFYHDHTKIILSTFQEEYILTFVNTERTACTFRLSTLLTYGCTAELQERIEYAFTVLEYL
ncbi:inactive serine/threonine-protein kinase PLK5 [Protopterus annectens]|uniref:inactive serine/threonine-protein kinase PLK5 n=1 Tax=Protopterus annectens TaxID=7888 RepID=UPI001CFBF89C|nr:inactive serine/threonine-protein kinase PLK5 [Protopterus annectens]